MSTQEESVEQALSFLKDALQGTDLRAENAELRAMLARLTPSTIGGRIKALYKMSDYENYDQLAEASGASVTSINNWVGDRNTPSARNLEKLAKALKTTSAYLLGVTDDPRPGGTHIKASDWTLTMEPEQQEWHLAS